MTELNALSKVRGGIVDELLKVRPHARVRDIVAEASEIERYIVNGATPVNGHVIVRESHGEVTTDVYYADTIDQARELRSKLVDETGETWRIAARVD
jgi:hypothetical protein